MVFFIIHIVSALDWNQNDAVKLFLLFLSFLFSLFIFSLFLPLHFVDCAGYVLWTD